MRSKPEAGVARVRVGVDIGGTFTDVVIVDEDTGRLSFTKATPI